MPKPTIELTIEEQALARAKHREFILDRFEECINEAWSEFKSPVEVTLLSKRFAKLCQYRGFRFAEMLQSFKEERAIHFIMLSSLKRLVMPISAWESLGEIAQMELLSSLQSKHVSKRQPIHSGNINFSKAEPEKAFFSSLPKNDTTAETSTKPE